MRTFRGRLALCRFLPNLLRLVPFAFLFAAGEAHAFLTYNIYQAGSDVVVTASGSLALPASLGGFTLSNVPPGNLLRTSSVLTTGPNNVPLQSYRLETVLDGLAGAAAITTTNVSGDSIFFIGGGDWSGVAPGPYYRTSVASGVAISSSATFANQDLAGLGFATPGLIGHWRVIRSVADGDTPYTSDNIYVCVGASPCAPPVSSVPGPLPLLGAGAAFGWSRRLRRRVGVAAPRSRD